MIFSVSKITWYIRHIPVAIFNTYSLDTLDYIICTKTSILGVIKTNILTKL